MVKLIVGNKGTGKTKTLIDMVNEAVETSNGAVVCLEKGEKLRYDVKYQARLIDVSEYGISGADQLYSFVCGVYASNHDITHIFIDSAIKMCDNTVEGLASFLRRVSPTVDKAGIALVLTSSISEDELPEDIKAFL
ncbi:MAG: ATP-binding protein [Clostridia bacterium]|nr:ATP-binding protein [Clostridia bacterium]